MNDNEEEELRSVALQNARSILLARRRAEEALRKQSEWLRVTLSSIGDAVISTGSDFGITFMNGVAESLTGWPQSEALGRPLQDVFHIINEHSRLRVENPALRALQGETVTGLASHTILIARDGTEWPIDDSAAPIRNEQGEVAGVVLVFRDITERKRDEVAREERTRLVALRADVSQALASGQATLTTLQQCCETLVQHLDVSFAGIWTLNDAGDLLESQVRAGLITLLDGPPSRVPVGQFNIGRIASSGEPYLTNDVSDDPNVGNPEWAKREGMSAFAGYPLMVEGRVVGVVATFASHALSDGVLTELAPLADGIAQYIDRRRTAERFRHQAELHRVTLASIGDAVLTTDVFGNVTYLNNVAENLTGWKSEDAQGKPLRMVFNIISERTRESVENPVESVLREGKVVGLANHSILISKDGTERGIDDSAAPIRDDNGRVVGVVLVFHDVTERRRVEMNLAFLANITHYLARLTDIDDIMQTAGATIGEYLKLSAVAFIEINEAADKAVVTHDWHREDATSLVGHYRIGDFVSDEFQRASRAGETFIVRDTVADPRSVAKKFADFKIRSFVSVPFVRAGQWQFLLVLVDSKLHDWRPDEVELIREVTTRLWTRLERARAEGELRESEQKLRAIFHGTQEYIGLITPDGTLLEANRASLEFAGINRDEIVGLPFWETFWFKYTPGTAELVRQAIARAAAGELVRFEAPIINPSGETMTFEISFYPIRNEQGEVVLIVPEGREVTERKRADEALRASEARFRAAVEAVSNLVWTNNAEGMMEGEQPGWENFTGQTYEDYQGYGWSNAVHPEDAQPTIDAWKQAVVEKRPFVYEHRVRRKDGMWRLCSIRAVPVSTEENAIREWVGVHTDITDRRRDEEALKDADRRKDEFLAMLAHELRNPLAPIRNALAIVRLTEGNSEAVKSAFQIMERQIHQMVRLVDDLLDVNRISQGKIELRRERVELASAIRQAVETCRPTLESAKHELTLLLPAQPIYLHADPVRLAQAFSNLLNNACKYTEPGGHISVTAEVQDGNVLVTVKDTGVGIPPDMVRNIFDIFAQVDRSLERSQGGLGIGLTLVKELVEMHGGMVEARSEGPGKGSEFIVLLPIAEQGVEQEPQPQVFDEEPLKQPIARRILVVDDNQDSAESLVILLRMVGHEVSTAHDGLEAVDLAVAFRPDVVLLDIGLPKLNGFEAARRIREQVSSRDMVLVALTGWGQEQDRRRSREAGFDHHLTKPVEFSALEKLIDGMAGGQPVVKASD